MRSFWKDGSGSIYHADARAVLPGLKGDLVCADPPYNVGKDYGTWDDNLPEEEYQSAMREVVNLCLAVAPNQFWVVPTSKLRFWMTLLPGAHLVVIKRNAGGPVREGWSHQYQLALALGKPLCSPNAPWDLWEGIRLVGEGYLFREDTFGHPGYTPYPIMARAITLLSEPGATVIDPFAGVGNTMVAARALGRKAHGIDVHGPYCEIAASRCKQTVMALDGSEGVAAVAATPEGVPLWMFD